MKQLWNDETDEPIGAQMDEEEWQLFYRLMQGMSLNDLRDRDDIHPLIRDSLAKYQNFLGCQLRLMGVNPKTWFLMFKCEAEKDQPPPNPPCQVVKVKDILYGISKLRSVVNYSASSCMSHILKYASTIFDGFGDASSRSFAWWVSDHQIISDSPFYSETMKAIDLQLQDDKTLRKNAILTIFCDTDDLGEFRNKHPESVIAVRLYGNCICKQFFERVLHCKTPLHTLEAFEKSDIYSSLWGILFAGDQTVAIVMSEKFFTYELFDESGNSVKMQTTKYQMGRLDYSSLMYIFEQRIREEITSLPNSSEETDADHSFYSFSPSTDRVIREQSELLCEIQERNERDDQDIT